jgi:RNA 3'-terminal phosphate cyclase (ATP)
MSDLLTLDGSYGEGGGQVIRTSVALAAITGRPLEIHNVRGNRAKPGLQAQHLTAVRAAGEICGARIKGDAVGSIYLSFEPTKKPEAGEFHFDIGTAGSATLVLQTLIAPLAVASGESRVTVTGGTHNPMAPSVDYLEHVVLPAYARMGLQSRMEWPKAGFFPRGGGEVSLRFSLADEFQGIDLSGRGEIRKTLAAITTAELPDTVGDRGSRALWPFLPAQTPVEVNRKPSKGAGAASFIGVHAENGFAGFVGLGAKGKPMERVSEEAGDAYREWLETGAAVDEHLADQLVIPAILANGPSAWRPSEVTEHLRTMAWLVPQLLPVDVKIGPDGVVRVSR